jgi:inosine-uridine nucleoside N-ribohydrolase
MLVRRGGTRRVRDGQHSADLQGVLTALPPGLRTPAEAAGLGAGRMMQRCLLVLVVKGSIVAAAPPQPLPRLIIDTDMSGDCDDVGAVCLAHALMGRGEVELLAVVHNTGLDTGVGAISAINTYYQRPNIPVGAYKGSFDRGLRGPYVDDLVRRFPSKLQNASGAPDALHVYRRALAGSADRSVWVSSIGFTTNLEALLKSAPDEISPLNGTELVTQKVRGLAWMGGRYPSSAPDPEQPHFPSPEHNFGFHCGGATPRCNNVSSDPIAPSTAFVVEHWPASVPIVFLGWEIGHPILTGAVMTNGTAANNPCRQAYIDHGNGLVGRSSWDPATTLFAVRGAGTFYTLVAGRNVVDPGTGNNAWHADAQGRAQSYLVQRAPIESVRDAINELLLLPPPSLAAP